MLTKLDEALLHQAPVTFAHTEVSDHRFYDRVYVEAVDPAGSAAFGMGIGLYKNTNTLDGFVSVQRDDRQYNVRLSRALRPAVDDTTLGPLVYEVAEPMRSVRVSLAEGEHGIACDVIFEGVVAPIEEIDHFSRVEGRVQEQVHRYNQVGRASGWISVEGTRFEIADWWAVRDHSWGVRPGVGGFDPKTGGMPPELAGFLYSWVTFSTDDLVGYVQVHENGAGARTTCDGVVRSRIGGGYRTVSEAEYEFEFPDGSRLYERARLAITTEDGATLDVRAERLLPPWVMRGTGYDRGYSDSKGVGAHRGPYLCEHDVYDLSHPSEVVVLPDGAVLPHFHREHLVRVRVDEAPGTGHLTALCIGGLPKYGLPPFTADELIALMRMSPSQG